MGSFCFLFVRNPEDWNAATDRQTDLYLYYEQWEALFFKVLGCPDSEYIVGESGEAFDERWTQNFREAIPEYPLLGRISYFFHDVWYAPEELTQLRDECQSLRNKTDDKDAIGGLEALISGCNEAQRCNLGLFLGAD